MNTKTKGVTVVLMVCVLLIVGFYFASMYGAFPPGSGAWPTPPVFPSASSGAVPTATPFAYPTSSPQPYATYTPAPVEGYEETPAPSFSPYPYPSYSPFPPFPTYSPYFPEYYPLPTFSPLPTFNPFPTYPAYYNSLSLSLSPSPAVAGQPVVGTVESYFANIDVTVHYINNAVGVPYSFTVHVGSGFTGQFGVVLSHGVYDFYVSDGSVTSNHFYLVVN